MIISMSRMGAVLFLLVVPALAAAAGEGGRTAFIRPQAKDKCPVCGMFVARYPDWTAEVVFKDGTYAVFDGAKDLFKCVLSLGACIRGKGREDVAAVYVTDYYDVQPVDATRAFFVLGSDVYGPMGKEPVPFAGEKDARQFQKDHKGKRVLQYRDITQTVIEELER